MPNAEADDLLRRLPRDPELAIEITEGIEHWRGGQITLRVDGSGAVEVLHRRAGEERRYAGRLDEADLSRLAARLADLGYASLATIERDQAPDELNLTLAIERRDEQVFRAEIPEGERHDDPRLAAIMAEYEFLVEAVTDHDLPYGPAAAPR